MKRIGETSPQQISTIMCILDIEKITFDDHRPLLSQIDIPEFLYGELMSVFAVDLVGTVKKVLYCVVFKEVMGLPIFQLHFLVYTFRDGRSRLFI